MSEDCKGKKIKKKKERKKKLFYKWTDLPGRVDQVKPIFFFYFGGKNDPKNMKISKNQMHLAEKFLHSNL